MHERVYLHAGTQAYVCKSMWVWYGLLWVNTGVHTVAKPLNGINSRWARKMKDAIYLGFVFPPRFASFNKLLCSKLRIYILYSMFVYTRDTMVCVCVFACV